MTAKRYLGGLIVAAGIAWPLFVYGCDCWWCVECWLF